jgi:hypothetical protein
VAKAAAPSEPLSVIFNLARMQAAEQFAQAFIASVPKAAFAPYRARCEILGQLPEQPDDLQRSLFLSGSALVGLGHKTLPALGRDGIEYWTALRRALPGEGAGREDLLRFGAMAVSFSDRLARGRDDDDVEVGKWLRRAQFGGLFVSQRFMAEPDFVAKPDDPLVSAPSL